MDRAGNPPKLPGKIMHEAHLQQEEIKKSGYEDGALRDSLSGAVQSLKGEIHDSEDEDGWSEPGSDFDPEEWEAEIDEEDEAILARFMSSSGKNHKQKTLADIIMEKIQEKKKAKG